jgi:hypothetical protein
MNILRKEIFSVSPNTPIAVVSMRMHGPTKAKELLRTKALLMSLIRKMSIATVISIEPDNIRSSVMPMIALSSPWNTLYTSSLLYVCSIYMLRVVLFRTGSLKRGVSDHRAIRPDF